MQILVYQPNTSKESSSLVLLACSWRFLIAKCSIVESSILCVCAVTRKAGKCKNNNNLLQEYVHTKIDKERSEEEKNMLYSVFLHAETKLAVI